MNNIRPLTKGGNMVKETLKYENTAKIGDTIKAYDFARYGEKESYIQGIVVEKGMCDDKYYACYKIKLTKRLVAGKDRTQSTIDAGADVWYVPFETCDDTREFRNPELQKKVLTRVVKIKEAA